MSRRPPRPRRRHRDLPAQRAAVRRVGRPHPGDPRPRSALSDGELGLALAFLPVGAIIAMPLAGALAARVGSRRATRAAFALACTAIGVVALAPSLAALRRARVRLGRRHGLLDVAMNVHGVTVERRYGRPILSGFHAAFSLGGLAGAALGALAAGAGRRRARPLAASRPRLRGRRGSCGRGASCRRRPTRRRPGTPCSSARRGASGRSARSRSPACSSRAASADWSGVYIKDELGTGPGFAALGFTAFSVTMTLGRIFGDRLVLRLGGRRARAHRRRRRGRRLRRSRSSSSRRPAALVGFACLGAGMSSVMPIVFRAAGSVPGIASGVALSAVTSVGYLGFVAGPPAIGGIAELVGLPTALGVLVAARGGRRRAGGDDEPPGRARPAAAGARGPSVRGGGGMTVVLSDLDGVLVDSQASIMRAWHWWGSATASRARRSTRVPHGRPVERDHRRAHAGPRRRGRVGARSTGARPRTSATSSRCPGAADGAARVRA